MDYVWVSINYVNMRNLELKMPSSCTVEELIRMVTDIYGTNEGRSTKIQAEPLGRILDNAKTLSEEGVATGSLLTFI